MLSSIVSDNQFLVGLSLGIVFSYVVAHWKCNKPCHASQESTSKPIGKKKKKVSDLKMVLVVRKDVKLTKRELATQCVHACVEAFKESLNKNPDYVKQWHRWGEKKIAVKVNSEADLLAVKKNADDNNLVNFLTKDSDPSKNTALTLAIGPDSCKEIDAVTGHLKLL